MKYISLNLLAASASVLSFSYAHADTSNSGSLGTPVKYIGYSPTINCSAPCSVAGSTAHGANCNKQQTTLGYLTNQDCLAALQLKCNQACDTLLENIEPASSN